MGADCGCGGTCPMCSYVAGFIIPDHVEKIKEAAKREGLSQKEIKPEREKGGEQLH